MKQNSYAKKIWQGLINVVIPPTCLSCRTVVNEQGQICANCWKDIKFIGNFSCARCGLPFEFDMGHDAICASCRAEKPLYRKIMALCRHEGVGQKLAVRLKFGDKPYLAKHMASMMANRGASVIKKADIIAPVPLHFRRKFFRKYNQAALLAVQIAKISGKKYEPFLLTRTRHTNQQTRLTKTQRKKNLLDAFVCNYDVAGKNILLIDDVMTTGATINSAAAALKQADAKTIYGLVFGRVVVRD